MPSDPGPATSVLQLQIALRGLSPSVWRRVLVPEHLTLGQLHKVSSWAGPTNICTRSAFVAGVTAKRRSAPAYGSGGRGAGALAEKKKAPAAGKEWVLKEIRGNRVCPVSL
ncbi:IS1096 element passenger TnpR family protein [Cupriavidus sp. 8B]